MLCLMNEEVLNRAVIIMSEIAVLAASAKTTLNEIAKQAMALGTGLQNAAPGEKSGSPNNSVQYLLTTSEALAKIAAECDSFLAASLAKDNQPKV